MPGALDRLFDHVRADHHVDTHLGQGVSCPGFRAEVPITVFGDCHACACHDECRRGRDVQGALAISTRAHDVHGTFRGLNRVAFGAHDGCRCGVFVHRLATRAQRHQETANLAWCGFAFKENLKGRLSLRAGQRAVGRGINERFQCVAHAATGIRSRKF